jgi:hypothetical protein
MVQTGWLIDSAWWWLALWLPSLAFVIPFGSGRKEHRS